MIIVRRFMMMFQVWRRQREAEHIYRAPQRQLRRNLRSARPMRRQRLPNLAKLDERSSFSTWMTPQQRHWQTARNKQRRETWRKSVPLLSPTPLIQKLPPMPEQQPRRNAFPEKFRQPAASQELWKDPFLSRDTNLREKKRDLCEMLPRVETLDIRKNRIKNKTLFHHPSLLFSH